MVLSINNFGIVQRPLFAQEIIFTHKQLTAMI